jgi:hypothetical protein
MNEDWENEEIWDIEEPHFPDALREHGKCFKNPAKYVIDLGNGEYVLYAEDGELLDAVSNYF